MKIENLKVAIVHEFLLKIGGAEKVLSALLESFPDADVYTFLYDEDKTKGVFKNINIITSNLQNNRLFSSKPKFLLSQYPKAIEDFDLSSYDLVISNSNSFAHGVITKPKTLHIVYCNSPMRYAWDWYHQYLAENNLEHGIKSMYVRKVLHQIRIWDNIASNRSDIWIANSVEVQRRIQKYYRKESIVIYPPVDVFNISMSKTTPDSYYTIVSRLEPYKKIDLAVRAFNKNGRTLIIIGEGSERERLQKMSHRNIEFMGWQSDKAVHEYLRNTKALIFPGEEDFGITPVEAMACGRPVVAYARGGALETVLPQKTGVFFQEDDNESLDRAIHNLENNYTDFTPIACRRQAELFSKEIFIQNIKKIAQDNIGKKI